MPSLSRGVRASGLVLLLVCILGSGGRVAGEDRAPARGVAHPPDLTSAEARKRLSMLRRRVVELRRKSADLLESCNTCTGRGQLPIYERQARTDRNGKTYYVTRKVGYRTCDKCKGLPYSFKTDTFRFVFHEVWSPARQAAVAPPRGDGRSAAEEGPAQPAYPFDPAQLLHYKWPGFIDGTHALLWIRTPGPRRYAPVRWIWSARAAAKGAWYLYDERYDGPWPKLVADGTADDAPSPKLPEEARAEPTGLRDSYDRFLGTRVLRLVSGPFEARHKDDPQKAITLVVRWAGFQGAAGGRDHELSIESRGTLRRWPAEATVYVLSDGRRSQFVARARLVVEGATAREVLTLPSSEAAIRALVTAAKVEMRAGSWEFELPAALRSSIADGLKRMEVEPPPHTPPGTATPSDPVGEIGRQERSDRFTGAGSITLGPVALSGRSPGNSKDAAPVHGFWHTVLQDGKALRHELRLENASAQRLWNGTSTLHLLIDGARVHVPAVGAIVTEGGVSREVLTVIARAPWRTSLPQAKRVELRAGACELELPMAFRALLREFVALPPASGPTPAGSASGASAAPKDPSAAAAKATATDRALQAMPGGLFGHRLDRSRLARRGGSKETERAVHAALRWLAAHQSPDGRWEAAGFQAWCDGKPRAPDAQQAGLGKAMYDPGVTGLALCAFLGAGISPQRVHPQATVVERGLAYLRSQQDKHGFYGPRSTQQAIYNHATAALAMVEAYALTGRPEYRASAQEAIDLIYNARNPQRAWRYGIRPGDNDTSITAWMLTVLGTAARVNRLAAERDLAAPFRLEDAAVRDGLRFLENTTDLKTGRVGYVRRGTGPARPQDVIDRFPGAVSESMTAAAALARIMHGVDPRKSVAVSRAVKLLEKLPPTWSPKDGRIDMYYWYYGTQVMRAVGGTAWVTWNAALKRALLSSQRMQGDWCGTWGSWDPIGPWGNDGGRVYSTALMALCLESYYRLPDRAP